VLRQSAAYGFLVHSFAEQLVAVGGGWLRSCLHNSDCDFNLMGNCLGLNIALLLARVLMAPIMVVYGAQKLYDINNFLNNPATNRLMEILASGAPAPIWFAYANGLFQLLVGVFVLLGFKTRISAALVVLWLIPVTYFGHPFWAGVNPVSNEPQFYKNLAIISAYLLIACTGPGRFSVDSMRSKTGFW